MLYSYWQISSLIWTKIHTTWHWFYHWYQSLTACEMAGYRAWIRGAIHSTKISTDREKWSASKGGPVFSKLFRLDRTDPLSFGPKFPKILVEWISPKVSVLQIARLKLIFPKFKHDLGDWKDLMVWYFSTQIIHVCPWKQWREKYKAIFQNPFSPIT